MYFAKIVSVNKRNETKTNKRKGIKHKGQRIKLGISNFVLRYA